MQPICKPIQFRVTIVVVSHDMPNINGIVKTQFLKLSQEING